MKYVSASILFFCASVCVASNETPRTYCEKLKKGDVLQIDKEEQVLLAKGFKVETAIAGEAGHNTRMLMLSLKSNSKDKCDIVVRDGKVAEIRL